jgi:proteasome accessory factor B
LQGRRSYTAQELARELEVSRRTIFRDLNMLELAHIPYYYDPTSGGYKINQHFFLPPINLTINEALAILMLTGRLRGASRLPLLAHGAQAAAKLESALPKAIRDHVGSVLENLSVVLGPVSKHEGLDSTFNELATAIVDKRICRLMYISFHERKQIAVNVHPLRLVFQDKAWYLIAYSPKHKEIRTFKLGRIRKLTVGSRKFSPPRDVDLEEHFGDAWSMIPEGKLYDVHLHFAPKVGGNVAEVGWHRSQKIEWNDDGSIEFRVTVDGLGEITWWILGYGDQVEVISPAALRKRVAAVAASMAKKYRKEAR